jgi:hypothetical protein
MAEELCRASFAGEVGKVEGMFLAKPSGIDVKDEDERTALHWVGFCRQPIPQIWR